ncbi:hypothetical protein [Nocardioides ochotonae]|uniref:hypothetical protein n=1 Tax=Nocardioides ochotonae TaxID=2685869 RepID=UPI00140D8385|nr:hypothetical protein [Nocardioides ochotonae]
MNHADRSAGVWRGRQAWAAVVVIAVMLVWRALLMRDSYFNQDDFFITARATHEELTWAYLFEPIAGHVIPAQMLNFWMVGNLAPFRWGVVAAEAVVLQLIATVLMWHLLTRLLPGRWVRVLLLAVFAWTPLTLVTTLWWAAAIGLWPHLIFSILAMLLLTRAVQGAGRSWLNQLGCVLCLWAGLAWHERAVLIAPVLLALALALADDAAGWRRVPATLRRFAWLWVALAASLVTYLVVHTRITTVEGGTGSLTESLHITWEFIARNIVPGMLSGPWQAELQGGAVVPAHWVTAVSLVLAALILAVLLRRGGPARWWALLLVVGYVGSDLALVLAGRGGFGHLIGLDPRYSSDVPHIVVPAVALMLRQARPGLGLGLAALQTHRRRVLSIGVLTGVYLVGSAFGTAALVPHFQNVGDRDFVTTFRAELARDPNQVVWDALVPAELVLPLVGEDARLSAVFAPLPESPVFDEPSARLRLVDEEGRLHPVELDGSIPVPEGPAPDCGYAVTDATVRLPFVLPVSGRLLVSMGYFSNGESTVTVSAGDWSTSFLARPGPNEIWVPVPDLEEEIGALRLRADGGATVCVTRAAAGRPEIR